jgi:cystathionine beta-lyase
VEETGRRQVLCPLVQTGEGYRIDFEAMEAACDAGTRMLLLCHPHNPTGRAFTRGELEGLAALVRRHDLLVLSDEIHADLMLEHRTHIPFAMLGEDIAARTITLTSPSKAFNVAGLVLAVAVFGSPALREKFGQLTGHVRGGRSAFGLSATAAAWQEGEPWLEAVRAQLRANLAMLTTFVNSRWPRIRYVAPEATYLAWLDCRGLGLGEEPFQFFLREARVALSEGPSFGEDGQGFVRLNFATSPEILAEILRRMDDALVRAGKAWR